MTKLETNSGFSIVEALLVLVAVGILVFVGWYVYHARQSADKNYTTANSSTVPTYKKKVSTKKTALTPNPYTGWKSATLVYEKISYKYPSNWTLMDKSSSSNDCVKPGSDLVYLTSPTNEQVVLQTGLNCIGDAGATTFGSDNMTTMGQSMFLVYENSTNPTGPSPTSPDWACLAPTANPSTPLAFETKNIQSTDNDSPVSSFCYYPYDYSSLTGTAPTESVSSIQSSNDFTTAKLIFESMTY
jgi:hypothetical protein